MSWFEGRGGEGRGGRGGEGEEAHFSDLSTPYCIHTPSCSLLNSNTSTCQVKSVDLSIAQYLVKGSLFLLPSLSLPLHVNVCACVCHERAAAVLHPHLKPIEVRVEDPVLVLHVTLEPHGQLLVALGTDVNVVHYQQ